MAAMLVISSVLPLLTYTILGAAARRMKNDFGADILFFQAAAAELVLVLIAIGYSPATLEPGASIAWAIAEPVSKLSALIAAFVLLAELRHGFQEGS